MKEHTHAEITYMHHTAHWFSVLERWVIVNQDREPVAIVTTTTDSKMTEIAITLLLGEHKLPLDPLTRPGGVRTALRWVCQELNNDNLWLRTRLRLEREARLLDYSEPELLDCWHATNYKYCLRLLANLPGLLDWKRV